MGNDGFGDRGGPACAKAPAGTAAIGRVSAEMLM